MYNLLQVTCSTAVQLVPKEQPTVGQKRCPLSGGSPFPDKRHKQSVQTSLSIRSFLSKSNEINFCLLLTGRLTDQPTSQVRLLK